MCRSQNGVSTTGGYSLARRCSTLTIFISLHQRADSAIPSRRLVNNAPVMLADSPVPLMPPDRLEEVLHL